MKAVLMQNLNGFLQDQISRESVRESNSPKHLIFSPKNTGTNSYIAEKHFNKLKSNSLYRASDFPKK